MAATVERPDRLACLIDGVRRLTSSPEWQRFLDYQSRFYRYSPSNVMLIAAQRHDATRVASFHAWRQNGRFVRKGERAIWILAPVIARSKEGDVGELTRTVKGFRWVPVFDLAQTDGDDPPTVVRRLCGQDTAGCYERLVSVAQERGFTVDDAVLDDTMNGDCSHELHRIRIGVENTPAQRVKTLAHEIAHALLHESYDRRSLAELEAESVAYVVCQALGVDSGSYSFGYLATWAGGGEHAIAAIKASCQSIQWAAATILDAFHAFGGDTVATGTIGS